ncbi:MAG: Fic family protein [Candidatus ainarchaeum sp.]|nr:Fic family protein [Candidatus ainarchaeum sp.]
MLVVKKLKGKEYYYSFLSYFLINKSKSFSKYIGSKKPTASKLESIEIKFKEELILKLSKKDYSVQVISKDDLIKALLFRDAFNKKFASLSPAKRKKFEIDQTILFTLTTLTTEDVDVSLNDIKEAYIKELDLSLKEKISKNMLQAVESIKHVEKLDKKYLFDLHKKAMSEFETKNPGKIRDKQVYLHKRDEKNPLSIEIGYRPPHFNKVSDLLDEFVEWYNHTKLGPLEKAAVAHFKIYSIHPFLDGNKRVCRLVFNKTLLGEDFPLLNISEKKEPYFEALINSVEKNNPKELIEFTLKEYFRQIKEFLRS